MAGYEGNIEVSLPDLFAVAGANTDVEAATKALDQASTIVETVSGVVFESEFRDMFLKKSDALWIKRATVFQAAWLLEQNDALSRVAVNSLTQDGIRVDVDNELAFVLSPLAKRAMQNCSWNKSSTKKVSNGDTRGSFSYHIDDSHQWFPLGGA